MKKRVIAGLITMGMTFSLLAGNTAVGAEETTTLIVEEGAPGFSSLSLEDWINYEFNRDYDTVIADVTSYDRYYSQPIQD